MNKIISWALYFTAMFAPLLIWGWEADSQLPQVTVVGAVTPGHCTGFSSTLQLQDTGVACGTAGILSGVSQIASPTNNNLSILDGTNGVIANFASTSTALVNHFNIFGGNTGVSPLLAVGGSDTNINFTQAAKGTGGFFLNSNGGNTQVFQINGSTTAVNFLSVSPANTGNAPQIVAAGSDPNIALTIQAKGGGSVFFGASSANASVNILNNGSTAAAVLSTGNTGGHLSISTSGGGTPSLTGGCNGAGSSVTGNDTNGTVIGQTAAATSCTLGFGTSYASNPNCIVTGLSSPVTGVVNTNSGSLSINFASTANYKWSYICLGT